MKQFNSDKKYKSIEQVRELILSKSETLQNHVTSSFDMVRFPIPSDYEGFYNKYLIPEFKNSESTLGIKDLLKVLDDFTMNAQNDAMKTSCSLLAAFARSKYTPKNPNKKQFNKKSRDKKPYRGPKQNQIVPKNIQEIPDQKQINWGDHSDESNEN